jgi:hypothetical protein
MRIITVAGKYDEQTIHVKTITVIDPDSGGEVEVEIRKCVDSGAMIGIDGSYLESEQPVRNPYQTRGKLIIPDDES